MEENNGQEINKKIEKEKRIKKEMQKMKKLYKNLPKEKMDKISDLIYRASFMLVMAQDMEEEIKTTSYMTTTINASQQFVKTNPLLKEYRDTIKSYQAIIKQLDDITKDDISSASAPDELINFINQ